MKKLSQWFKRNDVNYMNLYVPPEKLPHEEHEQVDIVNLESDHESLKKAAYLLWEQDGCPCDKDEHYWQKAKDSQIKREII